MNFTITRQQKNGFSLIQLTDTTTQTVVSILPAFGAQLHAFEIPLNGSLFNIIDHYTNREELLQDLALSYKSAKLSPFACRIAEGIYIYDEQSLEIGRKFIDGSAIHGLLFDKSFNIVDEFANDHVAVLSLRYHFKRLEDGYPFDYTCDIRYTLHPNQVLQLETTVLNLEAFPIPMADGWHPYFTLGNSVNDYELHIRTNTLLEFDEHLVPNGHLLPDTRFTTPGRLNHTSLDNCFLLQPEEGTPCCQLFNPHNGLGLSIYASEAYPYFQVFTPDHRRSIALENLSGAPDCFNNGMGLLLLPPRHAATFNVWYQAGLTANV